MSNLLDKASIVTTPTAYDNGKILSVKPAPSLGSELVVNGDFATDSNWFKDANWSIANGKATSTGVGRMFQSIPFLETNIGTTVQVSFDIIDITANGVVVNCYGGVSQLFTTVGTHTFTTTTTNNTNLYFNNGGAGNLIGSIDNVSVKQAIDGDFNFTRNSSATRVNSQGLIEDITSNLPRIDYTGGVGHWLFEPQSTNLFLNSETLSTQGVSTNAASYTVSFYGTGSITFSGTHTGTLNGTGVSDRVSLTFTASSGTLTSTVSGSVTKAQVEASSFATSYIPTNGSTVTRLQDAAFGAGSSDLINSTEGVLYAEIAALADDGTNRNISLSEDAGDRVNILYRNGSNRMRFIVRVNNVNVFDTTITLPDITNYNKVALSFKENEFKLYVNGVKEVEQLSGSIFPINTLDALNFDQVSGAQPFFGKTKCVAVFKEALTDAELTCLTTI